MDEMNANVTYEEPVAEPVAEPTPDPAVVNEVADLANGSFGKGLAATIMANFPITCYIAIFLGLAGLKKSKRAGALASEHGIRVGGKGKAGKILSIVGIAYGGYMSLTWTLLIVIYGLYFLIIILLAIFGGI